jgi:two-component system nitrogen regulation response regulator GlnG
MATGREVHIEDLPPELLGGKPSTGSRESWEKNLSNWASQRFAEMKPGEPGLLDDALPKFERIMIKSALRETAGRKRDASVLLGWGRNTLTRKINELGLGDESLSD